MVRDMSMIKLTEEDKKLLLSWGYTESDFQQITEATSKSKTTYELENAPIGREEAIRLLGREQYLAGIARSTFHRTAAQDIESGEVVYFDSHKLFKRARSKKGLAYNPLAKPLKIEYTMKNKVRRTD